MSTLKSYTLTFNTNIKISADGGALSVDGGSPLVKEFMVKSNFYPLFAQTVQFKDDRKRLTHTSQSVFEQALLQQIVGYAMIPMTLLIRLPIINYLPKHFKRNSLLLNQRCLACSNPSRLKILRRSIV
ncbi:hypothetical protein JOD14_001251 [Enterococcus lemanii]|nr:hypothetical protein [Enterococcus lemanii]